MNIKQSLTRKIGPLAAWIWLVLFGVGVWYYRRKLSGGATASGTGTGSVGPAPATPQPQTVLQPGESVYDPNSGSLTTAPGGAGGGTDPSSSIDNLAQAIADAISQGSAGGQVSQGTTPGTTNTHPAAAPHRPRVGSAAGPHGAIVAPYGHKPKNKKGYRTVGTGHGGWIYVPMKKAPKAHPKPGRHAPPKTGSHRPRSAASILRGATRKKDSGDKKFSLPRKVTGPKSSRVRPKPQTPGVTHVVRQRPVAATRPAHRPAPTVQHRPSAPPARNPNRRRGRP